MLQTVTLLGEKRPITSPQGRIPAEIIVGIEDPDGYQHLMRSGDPQYPEPHERTPRRSTLTLGAKATERLVSIYDRLFVDGEFLNYDCNGFPLYVFGEIPELRRGPFVSTHGLDTPVFYNDLVEGYPYGIKNRAREPVHAMIATDALHSLSMMGRSVDGGGLMMRAANPHLMDLYGGVQIHEITRNDGAPIAIGV